LANGGHVMVDIDDKDEVQLKFEATEDTAKAAVVG
jgi:hypothetical protein